MSISYSLPSPIMEDNHPLRILDLHTSGLILVGFQCCNARRVSKFTTEVPYRTYLGSKIQCCTDRALCLEAHTYWTYLGN